jgi:hypothetical protein
VTTSHNGIVALSKGCFRVTWSGLGVASSADSGSTVIVPSAYDSVSIQVIGTFAGATITIEGSNNGGTTWATLNDSRGEGNAMTFTSADLRKLNEVPQMIRPTITSGSASNLSVIAIIRATKP